MKPIILIQKKEILKKVILLVKNTRKNLVVSMDLSDKFLPVDYKTALEECLKKGVKITRYCFGTQYEFIKYLKNNKTKIEYIYAGKRKEYQRLLISDNSKCFFKVGNQFLFTNNKTIITVLDSYINQTGE